MKKRKIVMPTTAEDAAIAHGTEQDSDTYEPTDEELARLRPTSCSRE
jgi:hypothetical protein